MKEFKLDDELIKADIHLADKQLTVKGSEETFTFNILKKEEKAFATLYHVEGFSSPFVLAPNKEGADLLIEGNRFVLKDLKKAKKSSGPSAQMEVISPMPGKIIKIYVKVGDGVEIGSPLLVLEAMKMEHTLKSNKKAVVKKINVVLGQMAQGGVELIELE